MRSFETGSDWPYGDILRAHGAIAEIIDRLRRNYEGAVDGPAPKERLADEIYRHQPNLLASVLVQQRLGVSYAKMEFLIEILLICYQAMKQTRLQWPRISQEEQEFRMERATAIVERFGNLEPQSQTQLASRHFDEFPEKVLLVFVTGEVREWLARVDQAGDAKEAIST